MGIQLVLPGWGYSLLLALLILRVFLSFGVTRCYVTLCPVRRILRDEIGQQFSMLEENTQLDLHVFFRFVRHPQFHPRVFLNKLLFLILILICVHLAISPPPTVGCCFSVCFFYSKDVYSLTIHGSYSYFIFATADEPLPILMSSCLRNKFFQMFSDHSVICFRSSLYLWCASYIHFLLS